MSDINIVEESKEHSHCHHYHISEKTVLYLSISFVVNLVLSLIEIIAGIISGSVALIGDALHNTSDAFSILIAVIAFKIGQKKANKKYTYGFKRAEIIGGFVNLILLFIAGLYLSVEGIERLINPEQINGKLIIIVSIIALMIDIITVKLSHHGSKHNLNMRMVFWHNLADVFGSVGVIISGVFVVLFQINYIDGLVALVISAYMIYHAYKDFPRIVDILMNAVPSHLDMEKVRKSLLSLSDVQDVHHLHIWRINEEDVSLECHIVSENPCITEQITLLLHHSFHIRHCTIQVESKCCEKQCSL